MKQIVNYSLVLLAGIFIALSCSKIDNLKDVDPNSGETEVSAGKQITIHATLSDALTRVSYALDENGQSPKLTLTWEDTDKLVVSSSTNVTVELENPTIDATGKTATFSGTLPEGGEPYTVVVKHSGTNLGAVQEQAADGDLGHLEYAAKATGVTEQDFKNLALTQTTGVLGLIAKIPTEVSAAVKAVIFQTESAIFNGSNKLTVNLGTAGAGVDNILYLYANVTEATIPANTEMFIRFKVGDGDYDYYTRYQKFDSEVSLVTGALNGLKLNCSHINQYAGKNDAGTEAAPYLIADKYQMTAVHELSSTTSKTYFKMIDDVDMTGMTTYVPINEGVTNYAQVVDFNGNHKTVSNLGKHLFYVLKGNVYDLTLDACSVNSRGILAEYIQGTGHTVTNVTVKDGSVNYTGSYDSSKGIGGLIGTINNGSGTVVTITNCKVSNTNVTAKGVVGGVIGYANSIINMSGCEYTGGTVTASNRWCGGMLGSTGDFASIITDCHVMNATVTSSSDRVGGFTGQIGRNGVTVRGCTVGTESQKVSVHSSLSGATVNLGGFVGVCYGTVTKNGDVRNKAFVTITCDNSNAGTTVNIGGFVGYLEKGSIDYSDANATISSIRGHQVGGFAAVLTNAGTCTIDNCTANGTVTGNNYVAGFIGLANAADHVITNNSSAGSVSGAATVAGFVGMASQGTLTKNATSCTVNASGANSGGFAGQLNGNVTVSKCFTTGTVTGNGNVCGGFTAIASNGATINDCYSTSNLGGGTRKRGGLVGHVDAGTVSINRCYTTSNISNNFEMGGLIGVVSVETLTMTKCAAWNGTLVAGSRLDSNWSSAACVGVTYLTCTLTDNYRSPNMDLLAYWGTNSECSINLPNSFQHPNVSASTPLTDPNGDAVSSSTMRPYQGKCEAGKTLSQLASTTLGWSSDVWDFSGDLPKLN